MWIRNKDNKLININLNRMVYFEPAFNGIYICSLDDSEEAVSIVGGMKNMGEVFENLCTALMYGLPYFDVYWEPTEIEQHRKDLINP